MRLLRRRLLLVLPTLLGMVTLVFGFLHLIPGDPVEIMLGESAAAGDVAALRHDLGLDRPLAVQYVRFLALAARGDLGRSITFRAPVAEVIRVRYPATLELAGGALLIALALALPLGIMAALRPRSAIDRVARAASLAGVCLPSFWLGPLLILLFALRLGWLPVSGRGGLEHLVLPALTLGLGMAGLLVRLTRASMITALAEDYVLTARAKGAPGWRVVLLHALRNALPPVATVAGLQAGGLLAGAIITETIFAWPGIGRLAVQAIDARDYPLVQGCVLVVGLTYVVINTATDLLHGLLDPRLRDAGSRPGRRAVTVGCSVLLLLALAGAAAPLVAPHDPYRTALEERLRPARTGHPLGQDTLGRDVLARLLHGARISLVVGGAAVVISLLVGLALGAVAGWAGGWVDEALTRVVDILLAFPGLLLAIALAAVLGPSLRNVVLALSVLGWTGYARLVRAEIARLRQREFVHAAEALGASPGRIVIRHLLPLAAPLVLVQATFGMAGAVVGEASLSFLGLGAPPPLPSWGAMIEEGRPFMLVAPHLVLWPGLALAATVLALQLIGDGLRDLLDVHADGGRF